MEKVDDDSTPHRVELKNATFIQRVNAVYTICSPIGVILFCFLILPLALGYGAVSLREELAPRINGDFSCSDNMPRCIGYPLGVIAWIYLWGWITILVFSSLCLVVYLTLAIVEICYDKFLYHYRKTLTEIMKEENSDTTALLRKKEK